MGVVCVMEMRRMSIIEDAHKYIIELDGVIYTVAPLPYDVKRMEEDVAYVDGNGFIYPYLGKHLPGIMKDREKKYGYYIDGNGNRHLAVPELDEDKERYSVERIVDLNMSNMINQINSMVEKEEISDIEEIDLTSDSSSSLSIAHDDDFLTKAIKKVILSKGVNIKRLKNELPNRHTFDNTFSSLKGPSMMSLKYFFRWVEMLDLDFEIRIKDGSASEKFPIGGEVVANREGEVLLIPVSSKDATNVVGTVFKYEEETVFMVNDRHSAKLIELELEQAGFKAYHIRLHDSQSIPSALETQRVLINYYGTIFSKKKLVEGDSVDLTESQAQVLLLPSEYSEDIFEDHVTAKQFIKIYNKETNK